MAKTEVSIIENERSKVEFGALALLSGFFYCERFYIKCSADHGIKVDCEDVDRSGGIRFTRCTPVTPVETKIIFTEP